MSLLVRNALVRLTVYWKAQGFSIMMLQFAYPLLMPAHSEDRDERAYQRLARQSRAGLSSK
jgi:hypothetical protein